MRHSVQFLAGFVSLILISQTGHALDDFGLGVSSLPGYVGINIAPLPPAPLISIAPPTVNYTDFISAKLDSIQTGINNDIQKNLATMQAQVQQNYVAGDQEMLNRTKSICAFTCGGTFGMTVQQRSNLGGSSGGGLPAAEGAKDQSPDTIDTSGTTYMVGGQASETFQEQPGSRLDLGNGSVSVNLNQFAPVDIGGGVADFSAITPSSNPVPTGLKLTDFGGQPAPVQPSAEPLRPPTFDPTASSYWSNGYAAINGPNEAMGYFSDLIQANQNVIANNPALNAAAQATHLIGELSWAPEYKESAFNAFSSGALSRTGDGSLRLVTCAHCIPVESGYGREGLDLNARAGWETYVVEAAGNYSLRLSQGVMQNFDSTSDGYQQNGLAYYGKQGRGDLAVLNANSRLADTPGLPIASAPVQPGETVYTLGGAGWVANVTPDGHRHVLVSQGTFEGFDDKNHQVMNIRMNTNPDLSTPTSMASGGGNSGSPIVVIRDGIAQQVGVHTHGSADGSPRAYGMAITSASGSNQVQFGAPPAPAPTVASSGSWFDGFVSLISGGDH